MDKQTSAEKNRVRKEFWRAHIESWKKSGLSQIDYCKENNLSRHRFTYWKGKGNKKPVPIKFIPVLQKASSSFRIKDSKSPLKVIIGERYCIEVGDGFSPDTLTRLMYTLEKM